ncbi:MAG: hypothetical protein H7068_02650 [Pedobacter sp.]|nr:hypothetical protein [Chitinophagaceae bacterium]
MTKKNAQIIPLLIVMVWVGCTYKKEVIDYPPVTTITCDTTNVRYSVEIVGILSTNCYSCHTAPASFGGGNVLNNYNSLKIYATSGLLYDVVNHTPGSDFMPKGGGKIADCDIAKIRTWIRKGSPNN